jgi:DNA repair exonuclease SbcCD nuclease subunit
MPAEDNCLPANVHIFTETTFNSVFLEHLDCSVTGIAHAHRGITGRVLTQSTACDRRTINLLLFHGSRDGFRPSEKECVIPFSDEELVECGFTYAAIGHYHSVGVISDNRGWVRGAYSGCLQGRGLDETGEKYALVGEIEPGGKVSIQTVEVAPRRIVGLEVDVTGAQNDVALSGRIGATMTAAGVRTCDIAHVSLFGSAAAGLEMDVSRLEPAGACFHFSADRRRVTPDYDLDALAGESAAGSVRSAFVRKMLELEAQAVDDLERKTLRDAVYYGLYALDGRKLEPRDAD